MLLHTIKSALQQGIRGSKPMKNDYWDPVKKRISTRLDYSLALKNHINFICGSDISETRLYNSQFTKFSPIRIITIETERNCLLKRPTPRHGICQKFYTPRFSG